MTGSVIGLSSDRSMDGLALYYYGTMEFIAMQTRQIIETMNNAGPQHNQRLHVRLPMPEQDPHGAHRYHLRNARAHP